MNLNAHGVVQGSPDTRLLCVPNIDICYCYLEGTEDQLAILRERLSAA